ncbi:hypothetical protein GR925_22430 [Streptomyces sp. HUCO-GS316]|uniref:hypothetical protein n=1 Tax=Streptomyces sp. HUCO-GS316 TaxID=2692198 RepID=UPI001371876F|nr:hypothetical protein [Streptomyces sp. HUCO-GS316]MXM66126.1 hypothetical protein [Streptomyces sp. HUCO-GS316]
MLVLAGVFAVAGCSTAGGSSSQDKRPPKAVSARKGKACSLLNVDELPGIFGEYEDFVGTRLDPVDGKRPWGCTWGNRTSYASVEEVSREVYRTGLEAPGVRSIPQGMGKGESFGVWPADEDDPMTFAFTVGARHYRFEVVPSRDGDYPRFEQNRIGQDLLRLLIPAMEDTLI